MTPCRAFELEGWASMCMRLEPSLSKRIGVPPTAARLPTPGLESCRPVTSWVETKPADVVSNRNAPPAPGAPGGVPPPAAAPRGGAADAGTRGGRDVGSKPAAAMSEPHSGGQARAGVRLSPGAEVVVGRDLLAVIDAVRAVAAAGLVVDRRHTGYVE